MAFPYLYCMAVYYTALCKGPAVDKSCKSLTLSQTAIQHMLVIIKRYRSSTYTRTNTHSHRCVCVGGTRILCIQLCWSLMCDTTTTLSRFYLAQVSTCIIKSVLMISRRSVMKSRNRTVIQTRCRWEITSLFACVLRNSLDYISMALVFNHDCGTFEMSAIVLIGRSLRAPLDE